MWISGRVGRRSGKRNDFPVCGSVNASVDEQRESAQRRDHRHDENNVRRTNDVGPLGRNRRKDRGERGGDSAPDCFAAEDA